MTLLSDLRPSDLADIASILARAILRSRKARNLPAPPSPCPGEKPLAAFAERSVHVGVVNAKRAQEK